jgi:hypothetical protein
MNQSSQPSKELPSDTEALDSVLYVLEGPSDTAPRPRPPNIPLTPPNRPPSPPPPETPPAS